MATDNKIGLTLVKKCQEVLDSVENNNDVLQTIKNAYQSASPSVNAPGFPLNTQQVSDANSMIAGLNTFLGDHSEIINVLKGINVGSHKGNALD
ncbi:hypothetical protein KAR10_02830 [bacterium]|nr:hypothetical protein [bacterium]